MNYDDILKQVIDLLSNISDAEEITAESELIEDLSLSSMDLLLLCSSMEDIFGVKIPEKMIRKMYTVEDMMEIVASLIQNSEKDSI